MAVHPSDIGLTPPLPSAPQGEFLMEVVASMDGSVAATDGCFDPSMDLMFVEEFAILCKILALANDTFVSDREASSFLVVITVSNY